MPTIRLVVWSEATQGTQGGQNRKPIIPETAQMGPLVVESIEDFESQL